MGTYLPTEYKNIIARFTYMYNFGLDNTVVEVKLLNLVAESEMCIADRSQNI